MTAAGKSDQELFDECTKHGVDILVCRDGQWRAHSYQPLGKTGILGTNADTARAAAERYLKRFEDPDYESKIIYEKKPPGC